jgi:hypothetical protein
VTSATLNLMALPRLTFRVPRLAANPRSAASSVAPVASGYEHSCVYLNANAYWFSRPVQTTCSEGER